MTFSDYDDTREFALSDEEMSEGHDEIVSEASNNSEHHAQEQEPSENSDEDSTLQNGPAFDFLKGNKYSGVIQMLIKKKKMS